jgi:hypothetical protein
MSNKTYDILKWIGLITVPVITFLTALVNVWWDFIPYGEQIVATLSLIDVLVGAVVAIAKNQYDRKQKQIEDKTYY